MNVARRFRLAYFGLAALFGVGVGTLVVAVERPAPTPRRPGLRGSRPPTGPRRSQAQIAEARRRAVPPPSGKRLVTSSRADPARCRTRSSSSRSRRRSPAAAERRPDDVRHEEDGDVHPLRRRAEVLDQGGHAVGRARSRPRREALELALYSFRYLDDTDSVVAFFPPEKGENMTHAYFFAKPELSKQLDPPLRLTLPQARRAPAGTAHGAGAEARRLADGSAAVPLRVAPRARRQQRARTGAGELARVDLLLACNLGSAYN